MLFYNCSITSIACINQYDKWFTVNIGKGEYCCGSAPYGYRINPENKKELVIVEDEAEVIRRVFELTNQRYSKIEICLLYTSVDKIYIYENKQIKIHIRYQDMIEKMKVIRRFYAEHRTECRKEVG